MVIETQEEGNVLVIRPKTDNLDAYNVADFKKEVVAVFEAKPRDVVLSMSYVQFVDSAGLGGILSCMRLMQTHEKRFVIAEMTPQVRSLFELVRIHKIIEIYNTTENAITALTV